MVVAKEQLNEVSFQYIGKKWTWEIIRTLFDGKSKFSEFLQSNPGLTKKILNQRLKELEKDKFIVKTIISNSPRHIDYHLTEKGYRLNSIFYELAFLKLN